MELCRAGSDPATYTSNSKEMADEVANHHETIQHKGFETPITLRETALNTILHDLPKIEDYSVSQIITAPS